MAHTCPWWLAYTFDNGLRRLLHRPEKVLGPYVREGMTVMDVGCGMGHFSMGMAEMVGKQGRVMAVDLQKEMLAVVEKRAQKAGVSDRIATYQCAPHSMGIHRDVDFALAFWMVHEVPDVEVFLKEILSCLKNNGLFLVAEPRFHVSQRAFQNMVREAEKIGFRGLDAPKIRFSRAALFCKESTANGPSATVA